MGNNENIFVQDINILRRAIKLIKNQQEEIEYLKNNRKQVKEQIEAAQLELGFCIDMLTDI